MSTTRAPQLGSVVWAEMIDANGIRKARPVVVVTATTNIIPGQAVRVLAITTRLPSPLPDDHVILPWDREGKARSGLRRKCAAVTTWQAEISRDAIQQVVGLLPPAVIEELLIKAAAALPPSPIDPGGASSDGGATTNPPTEPAL